MLLGGPQSTIKSHMIFSVLFCFAPFSIFSGRMGAPINLRSFKYNIYHEMKSLKLVWFQNRFNLRRHGLPISHCAPRGPSRFHLVLGGILQCVSVCVGA
jgi:hypothetical protein